MMTKMSRSCGRVLCMPAAVVLSFAMVGCAGQNTTADGDSVQRVDSTTAQPQPAQRDLSLTVYSSADPSSFDPEFYIALEREGLAPFSAWAVPGFGVVRDVRTLDLKQGVNTLSFTDVAQFIDPTTVSLVDLSVPENSPDSQKIKVLQQEFAFDLVSANKLLTKYIDRQITIQQKLADGSSKSITGTLLSANQGKVVLKTKTGMLVLNGDDDIQLGELPGGLLTKPTLQWQLLAPEAGQRSARTAYQTGGLSWRADYNLVLNEDETQASLSAWVTLLNLSGTSYPNTELKLIAGDVQTTKQKIVQERMEDHGSGGSLFGGGGFSESPFFEYHIYTLPRRVNVKQNALMQLELFPIVRHVNVKKVLSYTSYLHYYDHKKGPVSERDSDNFDTSHDVNVTLKFENKKDNQLGIPLPRGIMRAFKADRTPSAGRHQGSLEYIGESEISDVPENEPVEIYLGDSFDVKGKREQTAFTIDKEARVMTETIEVTLSSAKDAPQEVQISEAIFRWDTFEIINASQAYTLKNRTLKLAVTVPPKDKKTFTYTVRYTWDKNFGSE